MYKKIARIQCEDDFSDMIDELCDRFGDPPAAAMNLCRIALVRGLGASAGISKVEEREKDILFSVSAPNLSAVSALSQKYKGALRVVPGNPAAIVLRRQKGTVTADLAADFLTDYIEKSGN